jgi:hypothetical protein
MQIEELLRSRAKAISFRGRVVLFRSRPVGVLNPATLVGREAGGGICLSSSKGIFRVNVTSEKQFLTELVATGSLLPGSDDEIGQLVDLLDRPETSRTTSHFCCVASSCCEVLQFMSKITNATVAILGCGGIGSLTAVALAALPIKRLILMDFDHIESSNFNRQLFWRNNDIGRYKVDVLRSYILNRSESIVTCYRRKLTRALVGKVFADVNGALLTADEPIGLHARVSALAAKYSVHLVSAGYLPNQGVVAIGSSAEADTDSIRWQRLTSGIMPSYGPTNIEVAGLATGILVDLLSGRLTVPRSFEIAFDVRKFPRSSVKRYIAAAL